MQIIKKYCVNCEKFVIPIDKNKNKYALLAFALFIPTLSISLIIYLIWLYTHKKVCPICNLSYFDGSKGLEVIETK